MYKRNQFFRVCLLSYNKVVLYTNNKGNKFVEIHFLIQQDEKKKKKSCGKPQEAYRPRCKQSQLGRGVPYSRAPPSPKTGPVTRLGYPPLERTWGQRSPEGT